MRVLLIHQAFVGPGEAGGTRHYELARHCADEHGIRFTVVASPVSYLSGQTSGRAGVEDYDGVRVLRAYTPATLHRSFVWRIIAFLNFMITSGWLALRSGPADVVMGTTPPIFQAVSAWATAAVRRRPFLLEVRDLWPEFAIDMGVLKNPIVIVLARWLERFLYARSTHLLVNSPAYRDYLIAKGIPPAKITFIANGVEAGMFDPDPDQGQGFRRAWGLEDRFVVTYAGALGAANDIPTLLKAAKRLSERSERSQRSDRFDRDARPIHFLLVGDGKERANLEALTAEWQLDNVTFTGPVPKAAMPEVLAASDACVAILQDIPMFRTCYPNKVFDYMAAGRPTVLAIDGVIRQAMEAAQGGIFVRPGDDEALAAAITRLAAAPDRAKAMGEAARRYVLQNFDRRQQAEQFAALLQRLGARAKRQERG
ncbi:MAG: glycosyltransferase family 4 protein [Caldilineales bacterium]|nr:glycosyltransferase family 4 protein [Caldilineales bacterium]